MVDRYETPNSIHYLTFSTFRSMKFFRDNHLCEMFLVALGNTRIKHQFNLIAYVIMPDHVHLLIQEGENSSVSAMLSALKRGFAYRANRHIECKYPQWSSRMQVSVGDRVVQRFWQKGGGYDRAVTNEKLFREMLDYIHLNPVRAGLARTAESYLWSSANYWITGRQGSLKVDPPRFR